MNAYNRDKFSDRLTNADKARAAMLERFRARPGPDDPAVIARKAEQAAIEAAREIRMAERKAAKEAEAVRLAAEQAAMAAEQKIREREAAAEKAAVAARAVEAAAEAKAARDARYAARKVRKR